MPAIDLSLFDLFKIGPGPSSSHTIGPMKAGCDFRRLVKALPAETLGRAERLEIVLYGSLSATGHGHGTDRAVLAGLLGQTPEHCPPAFLDELARTPEQRRPLGLGPDSLTLGAADVVFGPLAHAFPSNNTLVIRLLGAADTPNPLAEREYASVGGGFLHYAGQPAAARGAPAHSYETMAGLRRLVGRTGLELPEIMLENEMAITGVSETAVWAGLDAVLGAMDAAVTAGLAAEGLLPGPLGLSRKAGRIYKRSLSKRQPHENALALLCAFAFAAAEENAAGHVIVTAPTCGSAGIIPATARFLRERQNVPEQSIREGLLAAAAVGFLAKHNATIAGAEGGCQAEIGVASAMAAAMLAQAAGYGLHVVENAAETALEHHLGMTCDPVGGFVQIPCIERNAMGAVKAYTAYLIAAAETPDHHKVGLDQAIEAMEATGRDMHCKYKETAQGGLAVSVPNC
ncbi:L-serine ammonia-lyase [Desulfovibrio sp. TomC]|uniref:L-serine ammonia-lyase n=1 Tax=Desulfovibrio sp. TomC TaxID=1562888 RepID=UPI0005739596|nr:L-serine ammonia-lyase [Desulfovibrio sp. TomC]KHK00887.1 L-serine dehydratase, beta subunit [Desulfovibrio sp. TomC]